MRLRVRRRKIFHTICKILICIFVLSTLYLFFNSKSTKPDIKKNTNFILKVFVIEDENDAISIWQNYTNEVGFPISGTLISISSHFRNGLRQSNEISHRNYISFSDLLNSVKEINFQTISLALTGFFKKIIWIYPMWIREKYIYKSIEQYVGVNNNNLCLCSFIGNITNPNETNCENIFPNFLESVETNDCQLFNDHWTFLSMQEIFAVVSLNEIALPPPVMININLDFFTIGHSNDFTMISPVVNSIQSIINSLFCVQQISDETIVDSWFNKLTENVQTKQTDTNIQLPEIPDKLYCKSEPSFVRETRLELVRQLKTLNLEQLKELSDVGICVRESFDWKKMKKNPKFQLCSSDKTLNNINHCNLSNDSCYNAEFHLQMEKLFKIFKDNIKQPTIISLIRSSRNGVVSHYNQYYLENSLLLNLIKIYKLRSSDIIYSKNLLGGSKGWSMRNEGNVNISDEIGQY